MNSKTVYLAVISLLSLGLLGATRAVAITLSNSSPSPLKTTAQIEVRLDTPAPAAGAVVNLSVDNAGLAAVPSTISIAAGQTSASFTLTSTVVDLTAPSPGVEITASYSGATVKKRVSVISSFDIPKVSVASTTVQGGTTIPLTIATHAPVPPTGIIYRVMATNTACGFKYFAKILPGQTAATQMIDACKNGSGQPYDLTYLVERTYANGSCAISNTSIVLHIVPVLPPKLVTFAFNGSFAIPGTPIGFSVSLANPAPAGGVTVLLAGAPGTITPLSVVIPVDKTTINADLTVIESSSRRIVVKATVGDSSLSAALSLSAAFRKESVVQPIIRR
jgi:hypothetical protein